jgi:hypothetical protein
VLTWSGRRRGCGIADRHRDHTAGIVLFVAAAAGVLAAR